MRERPLMCICTHTHVIGHLLWPNACRQSYKSHTLQKGISTQPPYWLPRQSRHTYPLPTRKLVLVPAAVLNSHHCSPKTPYPNPPPTLPHYTASTFGLVGYISARITWEEGQGMRLPPRPNPNYLHPPSEI